MTIAAGESFVTHIGHPSSMDCTNMIWLSRLAKAGQYNGPGGPEDKVKLESERRPGDQDTLGIQDLKREGLAP